MNADLKLTPDTRYGAGLLLITYRFGKACVENGGMNLNSYQPMSFYPLDDTNTQTLQALYALFISVYSNLDSEFYKGLVTSQSDPSYQAQTVDPSNTDTLATPTTPTDPFTPTTPTPTPPTSSSSSSSKLPLIAGVAGGVGAVIIIGIGVWCCVRSKKSRKCL